MIDHFGTCNSGATVSSYEGFKFRLSKMSLVALIILVPGRASKSPTVSFFGLLRTPFHVTSKEINIEQQKKSLGINGNLSKPMKIIRVPLD